MRKNVLAEKLRQGQLVLGITNMYPASGIIEGMCPGWDFVWSDAQHGEMSYDAMLHALQAAMAIGVETMVRAPGHEPSDLGRYADLCPSAIMVPMVSTVEQAEQLVRALRFPPLGDRSYGGRRVIDLDGREYYRERELLVVAQIETLEAIDQVARIAGTEGIDGLFFGPDDMKARMGIPINTAITDNTRLQEAMAATARAARQAGKFCGSVAVTPGAVTMVKDLGYRMVVGGGDIAFLRTLSAARLEELRQAAGSASEDAPKSGADVY